MQTRVLIPASTVIQLASDVQGVRKQCVSAARETGISSCMIILTKLANVVKIVTGLLSGLRYALTSIDSISIFRYFISTIQYIIHFCYHIDEIKLIVNIFHNVSLCLMTILSDY